MPDRSVAQTFHDARRRAVKLDVFPGEVPRTLSDAYAIQDEAISGWPTPVAGWKIAMITPQWRETYGAERLVGPFFFDSFTMCRERARIGVVDGGFCAIESEFVLKIGRDIPAGRSFINASELIPFVEAVHAGIEVAGSPLASINDLGPGAVVSDFGNCAGVVVGDQITDFGRGGLDEDTVRLEIDGAEVANGNALNVPGGPFEALLFLLRNLAARGRELRAGDWVSTGAAAGVHRAAIGSRAQAVFNENASVSVEVIAARPTQ